jgi:membrane-bound lytic murein transglycosylase MltF
LASLTLHIANAEAPVQEVKIPVHIEDHKAFAYALVEYKWDSDQWKYFDQIIIKESGWKSNAQNPTSSAYGLAQFLDSTWSLVGCKKTDDPDEQIVCATKYVSKVYGSPQRAYQHHVDHNWY